MAKLKKLLLIGACIASAAFLSGCNAGTVSQADMEAVRKENGTEAYEKAMRDQGRGAELDAQKAADAARMADGG